MMCMSGRGMMYRAVSGIHEGEWFRFLSKPLEDRTLGQAVLDAVQRHRELLALSGDRRRRERREALRTALEAEYPGISAPRRSDTIEVTADPWSAATALGIDLDRALEKV